MMGHREKQTQAEYDVFAKDIRDVERWTERASGRVKTRFSRRVRRKAKSVREIARRHGIALPTENCEWDVVTGRPFEQD